MHNVHADLQRPIRVVLFCGPLIERAAIRLICALQEHPEVEFLGGFCQSNGQTFPEQVKDLWRRRGVLGLPILAAEATTSLGRYIAHPRFELQLRRQAAWVRERVVVVPDLHAKEVLAKIRALAPDLGLIYGGPILRPKLFEIPRLKTLGIHHGKVPEYRGKKTTFWAMYHGESAVHVTIQRVNAGIDTGEVVKAGEIPVGGRRYGTVCRELEEVGLALYLEAILEVKRGEVNFRPQAGKKGKLYRDPTMGDILRFWWKQWRRLWTSTA